MLTVDQAEFRQVLGCFPTGVAVISFRDATQQPVGITISSFTSVSLAPPLILFCLDKNSSQLPRLRESEFFGVNILASNQHTLCQHFAKRATQRDWRNIAYQPGPLGTPLLDEGLAWLECRRTKQYHGGDHWIILGQVMALGLEQAKEAARPLLYYRSKLYPEQGKGSGEPQDG